MSQLPPPSMMCVGLNSMDRKNKSPFCAATPAVRPSAAWTSVAAWGRVASQGFPWGDGLGKSDFGLRGYLEPSVVTIPYGWGNGKMYP